MALEIRADEEAAARAAARWIATEARSAVERRGRFALAVSGGSTPWRMLRALAAEAMPWSSVHVFQVDERIAPAGHADRNLTRLRAALEETPLPPDQLHPMPVEEPDPDAAARVYEERLRQVLGTPPRLDLVHLGLGTDGHTASLLPGDPVMDRVDVSVAVTRTALEGRRRMTLTVPALARARRLLWLVTGKSKAPMLRRLLAGDPSIPAGRVYDETRSIVVVDRAAAPEAPAGAAT